MLGPGDWDYYPQIPQSCSFFLESSFITHSTEEKTRFGPKAAARSVTVLFFQ
jgi:hypothetical protein